LSRASQLIRGVGQTLSTWCVSEDDEHGNAG
jgi:hypothetical protein